MYTCKNCGCEFENAKIVYQSHGLLNPPYEEIFVCPDCESTNFENKKVTHCRCCGAKLLNNEKKYCSDKCEKLGIALRQKEQKRKKEYLESPICRLVKEVENYNKTHRTNYSYGQYVALVKPKGKRK